MAKGIERKYFVLSEEYEHLYTHPQLGTVVVKVANHKERQGQLGLTPFQVPRS